MGALTPGNIPWMTIQAWADIHELAPGETAMLDRCFLAMDEIYRAWFRAKNPG